MTTKRKSTGKKNARKGNSSFDSIECTPTQPWHKPLCSHCREPIEESNHAYAGWLEDDDGRTHSPVVVHTGAHCPYYPERHAPALINDLPVNAFRRSPMGAIMIALQRRGDTEPERMAWAIWVSVVLGLPFNVGRESVLDLRVHDEVAESVPRRVFTVEELAQADER